MRKMNLPLGAKMLLALAVLMTLLGLPKANVWTILWGCVSYFIYKRDYSKVAKVCKVFVWLQVVGIVLIFGFILFSALRPTDGINPYAELLTRLAMVEGLLIPLSVLYFWYFRKLSDAEVPKSTPSDELIGNGQQ